jgi:large subunit ribosomal protein L4
MTMSKVQVLDQSGNKIKDITAPKEIASYAVKEHLIYEAVQNYRSNQRRGTASTKTRADVRGGGRKPWRQKGTGRARAGSTRSPLWRSGGITFGPKPRDYSYAMPKKARKNAIKSAVAVKLAENQVVVVDSIKFEEPKTKSGAAFLKDLKLDSALIIDSQENTNLHLSFRNIPKVKTADWKLVNIYDVLNHKWLVFTEKAFESFLERLK